ncbi:unnamed protein product [Coffea canephora]|uniref:Uncharacterized protein n=1 Tax=Coffea canephora TaxID=49390 RepID=A0A068ULS3_COFCA|nr:unnamed protein product [Coffea canephora]
MATQLGRNFSKCLTARHFSAMGGTAMAPPPAHRFFSSEAATNSKKGRVRALVDFMELPYKLGLSAFLGAACGSLAAFIHLDGYDA